MTRCHECGNYLQEIKITTVDGVLKYQGYCGHCKKWRYINYERDKTHDKKRVDVSSILSKEKSKNEKRTGETR